MNKERLLQLAEHLEKGKLGHENFDFSTVNEFGEANKGKCGTNGCAIGELPVIWPDTFSFKAHQEITGIRMGKSMRTSFGCAEYWFEISPDESSFLFVPLGSHLDHDATKEQVAAHIRRFVENGGIYE